LVGIGASTVVCTGARDGAMTQIEVLSSPERRRLRDLLAEHKRNRPPRGTERMVSAFRHPDRQNTLSRSIFLLGQKWPL
jgi:hypothetical protein